MGHIAGNCAANDSLANKLAPYDYLLWRPMPRCWTTSRKTSALTGSSQPSSRPLPQKPPTSLVPDWATPAELATRTKSSAPSSIKRIFLGKYCIAAWYHSPYAEEYRQCENLYICERCLKYMKTRRTLDIHSKSCNYDITLEKVVYNDDACAVYELDANDHKA
ncbi:K(lysine) acetyltransferase, partial [Spiromyces aspiralis]